MEFEREGSLPSLAISTSPAATPVLSGLTRHNAHLKRFDGLSYGDITSTAKNDSLQAMTKSEEALRCLAETAKPRRFAALVPIEERVVRESEYVVVRSAPDGEKTQVKESGIVTKEDIGRFKFGFADPNEIIKNPKANDNRDQGALELSAKYRTATSAVTLVYPDNERTHSIPFKDCVIQYRESMNSNQGNYYANSNMTVGIPKVYMDKLFKDAASRGTRKEDSIKVGNKSNVVSYGDYYWYSCDLKDLDRKHVGTITHIGFLNENIRDVLIESKAHSWVFRNWCATN
ncbi:hypothetical protein SI65_02748 [Aspergillus cristatus]|uniref:Uncharacterized protein n=1 Tax=Aspergillus cristatus TaxID=573508 RepID=A0A1E3BLS1_ASPCR|nr:hypothetical protein SI65_02748 [Aspergillus cristatus]